MTKKIKKLYWYKVDRIYRNSVNDLPVKKEIIRTTNSNVFFNDELRSRECKEKKITNYHMWFETKKEALDWIEKRCKVQYKYLMERKQEILQLLNNVKNERGTK